MNEAIARAATNIGIAAAMNTDCKTCEYATHWQPNDHAHLRFRNIDSNEEERQESEKLICAGM